MCSADGTRPLHLAMLQGNFQTATRLIEGGALINAGDKQGRTAMAYERRVVTGFDKVVEPRKSRVLRGKEDILQMLREAGGVMEEPEEGPAFLAEYVSSAEPEPAAEPETAAEPAAEPEAVDSSTPPVTPQAAEKVAASPATPLDRLSNLEQAVGLPASTAGLMDRLESLEVAVHKADHVVDSGLAARIGALEKAIGM